MGASISKNEVNSMIQNTQSIISNYENICTVSGGSSQAQFDANGCTFGKNTTIDITSTQSVNQTCISSGTTRNSMTNDVKQSMQQSAQATTQAFAFPSLSLSESYITDSITLGQSIVDNYYNSCIAEGESAKSVFTCTNSSFGDGSLIKLSSYQDITQKCLQKYVTDNGSVLKLQSNLSQSDVAQNQSIFATFGIIFIILILIFAYAGVSLADNPLVEWGIVILVAISLITSVIYSATAKQNGNYPYNRT
jgi:hypothetical protein